MGGQRVVSQRRKSRHVFNTFQRIHLIVQLLYGFSVILFWGDLKQASGLDSGHWFWGTTLYLAVLLTVLGKAALISECVLYRCFEAMIYSYSSPSLWTKYTVAGNKYWSFDAYRLLICSTWCTAIPGSFVFTMLFLPLYAVVAPAIGFSMEYQGIVPRLWTNSIFYFVLLYIPLLCLVRDFAWK